MESPLISIITPVYNAEKHILYCMQNVQEQHFQNYEHIILDGGSSDSTIEIIKSFLPDNKNIRFYSEKDKGIYDAMNKGIEKSTATWIYFLGADDFFLEKDVLSKMAEHLQTSTADIVYGDVWNEKEQRNYDGAFDVEKILLHNICHQAIFYRRNVLINAGKFDLRYKTEADYAFNLQCWLNGSIIHKYVPINIAHYSEGGASSLANDPILKAAYPTLVIDQLLKGNWTAEKRREYLSIAMRKIILRYGIRRLFDEIKKNAAHRNILYDSLIKMLMQLPKGLLKVG